MIEALGGLVAIPQWFIWRLDWDASERKYKKHPCPPTGGTMKIDASLPQHWMTHADAIAALHLLNASGQATYALGFRLTAGCGYWFLDIDECVENGNLSSIATTMLSRFPGAFVEWSSSSRGVHIIGRGEAPAHRTKPPKDVADPLLPTKLEFYTEGRGIAFGLSGVAGGCADVAHDVSGLCAEYFPPAAVSVGELVGPRGDWRGPDDDDELIRRMLASKPSAAATFGNALGIHTLWSGPAPIDRESEADLALASHLAFWTGCDHERMLSLMWRSGLVRPKWREHRTYLKLTLDKAISGCLDVYQEAQRAPVTAMYATLPGPDEGGVLVTVAGQNLTRETTERMAVLSDMVSACGTVEEMHNTILPELRAGMIPAVLLEKFVREVAERLKVLGAPMRVPEIRHMIRPPLVQGEAGSPEVPGWAHTHCYVQTGDWFYNKQTGEEKSRQSFTFQYLREMPMGEDGRRVDPVLRCMQDWNMTIVYDTQYRPDMPEIFGEGGRAYVNSYTPMSVPEAAVGYTEAGVAAIEEFRMHLWHICDKRTDVYEQMIGWMAHNVQKPGVKIRWAPLVKGVEGDGKSVISDIMRAAMGVRNVRTTGVETLCANGGFTDWAAGRAVNFFEELLIRGPERYRIYNAIKQYITNNRISINRKGNGAIEVKNTCNHAGFTNFNDGVPLEDTDRRWLIVFTPWASLAQASEACGTDITKRLQGIFKSLEREPAQWRKWLLDYPIPESIDPNGNALHTEDKDQMRINGRDDIDGLVDDIIKMGGRGITTEVVSTACLSAMIKVQALMNGMDVPKTSTLAFVLARRGYSKFPPQIKWAGNPHRVWIKNGVKLTNDEIRQKLEGSGAN